MDCNLPGSSVHGMLQARILEWVDISSFGGPSRLRDRTPVTLGLYFSVTLAWWHWWSRIRLPMQEARVQPPGQEDPLQYETETHSSIPAWRIPWTEEPGRLQSMRSQRVGHDWLTNTFQYSCQKNPMDRRTWWATVHRVAKSQTWLGTTWIYYIMAFLPFHGSFMVRFFFYSFTQFLEITINVSRCSFLGAEMNMTV